jgi:hypothetical protein
VVRRHSFLALDRVKRFVSLPSRPTLTERVPGSHLMWDRLYPRGLTFRRREDYLGTSGKRRANVRPSRRVVSSLWPSLSHLPIR